MKLNHYTEGRAYLTGMFKVDMSMLTDREVRDAVDQLWTGGWPAFVHTCDPDRVVKTADTPPSVAEVRARVEHETGYKVGFYEDVLEARYSDTVIEVFIRMYDVTETARRYKVNRTGYKALRYVWNGTYHKLDPSFPIETWDEDESFDYVKWGKVHTEEVAASDKWQWEYCYRPGSSRSPMDGPAACDDWRMASHVKDDIEDDKPDSRTVYTSTASYGADLRGWK